MTPQRIQLSRVKGWRKPPNTVVVSRPSKWGNPYRLAAWNKPTAATRAVLVALFRRDLRSTITDEARGHYHRVQYFIDAHGLAGKNLACWCPLDQPCHADVLLELANGDSA